jgi:hypothetical protein
MGRCLFGILKALQKGWKISNHNTKIKLKSWDAEICFDRITKTRDGMLCGVELVPIQGELANLGSEKGNKKAQSTKDDQPSPPDEDKKTETWPTSEFSWTRTNFHEIFAHPSSSSMEATAAYHKWDLAGNLHPCESCKRCNTSAKKTQKFSDKNSTVPGERLYFDLSSAKGKTSLGGNRFWLAIVDDATGRMWSRLLKRKSDVPKEMVLVIQEIHDGDKTVKFLKCDNAGENVKLKTHCKESQDKKLRSIQFEFTGRGTPQWNGKVESKFAVVHRRVKAILWTAQLPEHLENKLWGETIISITPLENVLNCASGFAHASLELLSDTTFSNAGK